MRWIGITLLAWAAACPALAQEASALGDPLVVPEPPTAIELPMPPDMRLDVERLDGWLRVQDERDEAARIESGIWGVGLGAAQAGLGLWLMLDDVTLSGIPVRGLLGGFSLGFGLSMLAMGIYDLASHSFAHERRARWRRALAGGLTERELGRFEGELRAEAELARFLRFVGAATGFANAGAGLAAILVTAFAPLDVLGQAGGYAMGGTFMLVGLITGLAALLGESRAESEWRLYRSGGDIDDAAQGLDLTIAPSVSTEGGGIELRGTF
jgi:hypothetical protein